MTLKKITGMINVNYLGIVAGVLSIIVAGYNIKAYYKTLRRRG